LQPEWLPRKKFVLKGVGCEIKGEERAFFANRTKTLFPAEALLQGVPLAVEPAGGF
jgi:hypothetical protein